MRPAPSSRWRRYRFPLAVFVLGLTVTAALTLPAEVSYRNNERRLLNLQTSLTASLLGTAPRQTEATLGRVIGLTAESQDPVATFNAAIAPSLAPAGPYANATLAEVSNGQVTVLAHVGAASLKSPTTPSGLALFADAAKSTALSTARAVAPGVQKLGYLMAARGPKGTFVISAAQQLPMPDRVTIPKASPDANLDIAVYFGKRTSPADLVLGTRTLPHGITRQTTVPFGNNTLTVVASARDSLAGAWAQDLPWGVGVIGVLVSLWAAWEVSRLLARRSTAEARARANRELYERQRGVSEQLQRSLLPRTVPPISGMDIAARYVPSTGEAEVGGDWYSVVPVDEDTFAFVVGDVSGHGIAAAGMMAALRYTTRTLARLGYPPNEVLDRANDEVDIMVDECFATVVMGTVSPAASEIVVASAGHLPPYVRTPGGAGFVEFSAGPPLGIARDPVKAAAVAFPPGSTLVAFTDGLIERRDTGIEARLGRLAEVCVLPAATAEQLLTEILTAMVPDDHEDDIAILVIRSVGGDAHDLG